MKKILSFLLLGMLSIGMTWAEGYTPATDEVIILNEVYNAQKTSDGYSNHAAIAWGGTASTNSKKAGDPNNGGAATSSNVACYSVKGNGAGKNIDVKITGCDKITVYHEKHSSRYVQLKVGDNILGSGAANTYFTEVELNPGTDYTIRLQGTGSGSDQQDFYVYAIALKKFVPTIAPSITTDLSSTAEVVVGVEETLSIVASGAISYQWYTCDDAQKTNPVAIDGATDASYGYTAAAAGTNYLYCVATNTVGSTSSTVCAVTASVVALHSVTYAWGAHVEIPDSILPVQANVAEGHNFTVASLPAAIKYIFLGWSDGVNTYAAGAAYTMGTSDVTLTALWSEVAQSEITGEAIWNWANAGSSNHQLGEATYPSNGTEFVMANMDGIPNNANFNSQALLVVTQFANRGNDHYFQGNVIKFTTTVPGSVIVWFSNTSNREDTQKNRRFLYVNGENCGVYTLNQTFTHAGAHVDAGEVIISAMTGEATPAATMIRVQKIEFHPDVTLGTNGYSTYAAGFNYTVSGASAYIAKYNGSDAVTLNALAADAVIPANAGIILKGTEGETATIAYSNDEAIEIADNDLVGVVTPIAATAGMYVLSTNTGVTAFNPCQVGLEIPAHKAYLSISSNAPSIIRIIENATNIENVEANEEAVKFMQDGKLYIMKNGVLYNAVGAVVK